MAEWLESFTNLQLLFLIFAVVGTVLFLIQLVLILFGGDGGVDGDVDIGTSPDVGDGGIDASVELEVEHASSDASFKLLSFQGLTAFFMLFGLVGLAVNRGSGGGAAVSLIVALCTGLGSMWLVAKLFQLFRGLQSSGTINLANAVGQQARVYLRIKPDVPGQIEVAIQGHLKIYDAISVDNQEIQTDTRVEVVSVDGMTMVVKKI